MSKQHIGGVKVYKYGERGSGFVTKGEAQDFYKLRQECFDSKRLFEDPEFNHSLHDYEWKRPHEIVENPKFFVEGVSRFDIKQGVLGDCWFLAAVANLTLNPNLVQRVVPSDQEFDNQYAGIFHFRFWQYGKWVDVVVDDRLPTSYGKLMFMRSTKNEFWSALLEKAFAKLHGSYKALDGGLTHEAMEDFTGGTSEVLNLHLVPKNFYKTMKKAHERGSLMGCAKTDSLVMEDKTNEGLVTGHAYSITKVQTIDIPNVRTVNLIRIRNPWGNENEWNGAWSDKSPEWKMIPKEDRAELGLTFDNDGEFWMEYSDFIRHFTMIEFCHLTPDAVEEEQNTETSRKKWVTSLYEGEWVRGVSAGGSWLNMETFPCNPQYCITLQDPDEDDEDEECTLIVALMKTHSRRNKTADIPIGYTIYTIDNPDAVSIPLESSFFKQNEPVHKVKFTNTREVTERFKLAPGTYCIVPSTYQPNLETSFVLRVFSEHKNDLKEYDVLLQDLYVCIDSLNAESEKEAENELYYSFTDAAGEDRLLNWEELRSILNGSKGVQTIFSKDACRSLISLLDDDHSGKLDLTEFSKLAKMLSLWVEAWNLHDTDKSNTLSGFELRQVLYDAGLKVNTRLLNAIVLRYGNEDGELDFNDFILAVIKLKKMFDIFQEKEDRNGIASFNIEEWLEKTIYN